MNTTEVILVAVIIILTLLVIKNVAGKGHANGTNSVSSGNQPDQSWTCVNNNSGTVSNVAMNTEEPKTSYEKHADNQMSENQEYFSVCGNGDLQLTGCENNTDSSFAKFDYGAANMDYKDYVASQSVDNKVIENHLQFVRDRKGLGPEGEFITGRTYSPDSHDSYDPIPWAGIRGRPRYVQQCNPTQVPDVDTNLYKGNRPYCFWT